MRNCLQDATMRGSKQSPSGLNLQKAKLRSFGVEEKIFYSRAAKGREDGALSCSASHWSSSS